MVLCQCVNLADVSNRVDHTSIETNMLYSIKLAFSLVTNDEIYVEVTIAFFIMIQCVAI